MAETTYTILKEIAADKAQSGTASATPPRPASWYEIGKQVGGSGEGAVRAFLNLEGNGEKYGEGNYRGVAERSWGEVVPIQKKISFG